MSVRGDILAAVTAAFEALAFVGVVIDSGDFDPEISAALAAGKAVLEISAGSDRNLYAEGQDAGWNVETLRFDVVLVLHLPKALVGADPARVAATAKHLELYRVYATPPADGTWGGKALKTRLLGGGGYGPSAHGSRILAVEHAFEVTYRHTLGNPDLAR